LPSSLLLFQHVQSVVVTPRVTTKEQIKILSYNATQEQIEATDSATVEL